ncbi:sensor histidine kinase [Amycolatopsis viridis]|uniref:histidine kinase n=1 Tax=Amycolatopsis viridis TaxID=185678 RepID=A0ABX0SY09_9PSEU|nr:histidine kinase [Amycolatopsis viridis]NIH81833.1 signal transduction histidine kinase [Amycolatopsis viridis]
MPIPRASRQVLTDGAVAVLCVAVFWLPLPPGPVVVLVPLFVAGVLMRSRWPAVAFGVVATVTLAGALLGLTPDPFVAAAWTLYPLVVRAGGARSSRVAPVTLVVVVAVLLTAGSTAWDDVLRYVMVSLLVLAGAFRLGESIRREREEAARRAVLEERLRVAREVHDVVSHSLGTIAVTAGVAAHVGSDDAAKLTSRLTRIERTAKDALTDLRSVLGAVRDSARPAERAPQPGIADLEAVAERVRGTGIDVTLAVRNADGLPPSTGLAVYRIVQEGLTNAATHAPGCRCAVSVVVLDREVVVEVTNSGGTMGGGRHAGGGFGLIGLRERVESLGGELTAGSTADGGFALCAVLPEPRG